MHKSSLINVLESCNFLLCGYFTRGTTRCSLTEDVWLSRCVNGKWQIAYISMADDGDQYPVYRNEYIWKMHLEGRYDTQFPGINIDDVLFLYLHDGKAIQDDNALNVSLDSTSADVFSGHVADKFLDVVDALKKNIAYYKKRNEINKYKVYGDEAITHDVKKANWMIYALLLSFIAVYFYYNYRNGGILGLFTASGTDDCKKYWLIHSKVRAGEWYRLISYMFIHGNIYHLTGNCIVFYMVSYIYMNMVGWKGYLINFFGSGIIAGLTTVSLSDCTGFTSTVGASGAIFGLIGGILVCRVAYTGSSHSKRNIFVTFISVVFIFIQSSFVGSADWSCHLGGILFGIAVTVIICIIMCEKFDKKYTDNEIRIKKYISGSSQYHVNS